MKAIEFPEVNVRIAENQPEYETLPVHYCPDKETNGYFHRATMCFELDEQDRANLAHCFTATKYTFPSYYDVHNQT